MKQQYYYFTKIQFGGRLPGERKYLKALAETYDNASNWDTKRQTLAIMANLLTYHELQLLSIFITVSNSVHHIITKTTDNTPCYRVLTGGCTAMTNLFQVNSCTITTIGGIVPD